MYEDSEWEKKKKKKKKKKEKDNRPDFRELKSARFWIWLNHLIKTRLKLSFYIFFCVCVCVWGMGGVGGWFWGSISIPFRCNEQKDWRGVNG